MSELVRDLRLALRGLGRSRGFTVVAVLTLALGIGANSAIFSVLYAVVLKPLPYPASRDLVLVSTAFPGQGFDQFWISPPEYLELRDRLESFDRLGAWVRGAVNVTASGAEPFRASAGYATHELFETLGIEAARGRVFDAAEDRDGGPRVAVLSDELWRRAFGAEPGIVGQEVQIDGQAATVVGVMPPGFDVRDEGFELWLPLGLDPAAQNWGSHYLMAVGRLAPGKTMAQAEAEAESLYGAWDEERPQEHHPRPDAHPLRLDALQEDLVGPVRAALWTLFGAVGLVLAIACANVANLLLVRAESRRTEIAVRSTMGASRWQLVRQFLAEGVVLGLLGAAGGLVLAAVGLRTLLAVNPEAVPRMGEIALSGPVVGFTAAVAVATGLLFGLAPLVQLGRRGVAAALRAGGTRSVIGGRGLLRRGLVAAEVALAVVLVFGSTLMLKSFWNVLAVDPGFAPDGLVTFRIALPRSAFPEGEDATAFLERLLERVRALPGVESAAAMDGLPPQRQVNANDTEFEGLAQTPDGPPHNTDYWQFATADYFETMGIPILEGRGFAASDAAGATPVVVIGKATAERFWPGQSPLGRRLRAGWGDTPWRTVVGIAADVKQGGLDRPAGTELYFPAVQAPSQMPYTPRTYNVVVRSDTPFATLAPALRRTVWELDPALPVANLKTLGEVIYGTTARPRFLALLLGVFAGTALLLAAIGTYGVLAYQVAERRREIGVRMALGSPATRVLGLVLAQGMTLALIGVAVGVGASLGVSRLLEGMLFGVAPEDPATLVVVPLVLAGVALLACLVPAVRAARVEPSVALRYE